MERNIIFKLFCSGIAFPVLLITLTVSSCKKNEQAEVKQVSGALPSQGSIVPNDKLIKFLEISLQVEKGEVSFDTVSNEFEVGGIRLSRLDVQKHYEEANIYQATYGK